MNDTKRLVVLRHAKAERLGPTDHKRPLALRGRRQASAVGASLRAEGLVPDRVLCSSALRTRQTWDLVSSGIGPDAAEICCDVRDELYDASPRTIIALLNELTTEHTVLVVGHEPTVSVVSVLLAGPTSSPDVVDRVRHGVPTSAWTLLEVATPWCDLDTAGARLRSLRVPA
ncbi:MAG: histidine phosphatase family protein [Micrococcales bacterium]|nr:histidine phosphatase family protein [Micrococcales bacterium]